MGALNIENKSYDNNYYGECSVILNRNKEALVEISFAGNGDLYFTLFSPFNKSSIVIGHDNYQAYLAFDKLYNNILSGNIFQFRNDFNEDLKEIDEKRRYYQNLAKDIELVINDEIVWYSDDYPDEIAPLFKIKKEINSYILEFKKGHDKKIKFSNHLNNKNIISVRLRNSGSCYYPFNASFMQFFWDLKKVAEEMHQISIEEYLITKRVLKKNP